MNFDHSAFQNGFYNRLERYIPFEQYVEVDDNLAVCGTLTDKDIVDDILPNPDSSENEDEVISEPQIISGQALYNIYTLRRFLYAQDSVSVEIL